ncbi:hypothetical protein LDO26_07345 [Luteimonas sp. BDR2-5]|uniref:hypothetical protein n=1 Tax=Proluteimonas luteida TaxID=2878685 RepID=UPI001E5DDDF3|nr:hypothetical protein [Luteimonas sp. BDR2-5]MCD9028021.1 hypothetical protein [Luteimonas sp. BDR2-5]
MTHELVAAFDACGLPLRSSLRDMLDEHPTHQTERRGCGLTQATRLLAERINQPRDPRDTADLALFADWPLRATATVAARSLAAGWAGGWRQLADAPADVVAAVAGMEGADALLSLQQRLAAVAARLAHGESRLLLAMIDDLLACRAPPHPSLPGMTAKPEIGSCSQAEEFFLEIAHGKIRRGGRVNILVDDAGRPVLVEKISLGESHSALLLRPVAIRDVAIPAGGLLALRHQDDARAIAGHPHGDILPLTALAEARFLRLTTFAVPPADRERAFSTQFRRQVLGNMLSPRTTTLDDLHRYAGGRLQAA